MGRRCFRRVPARSGLRGFCTRPCRHAGCDGADGAAAVHASREESGRCTLNGALRSLDSSQGAGRFGFAGSDQQEQRGLQFPRVRFQQIRHRILEARCGHHPPGCARELRVPGWHDDRYGFTYGECRWIGHGGRGCGRCRRRGRDGRHAMGIEVPQTHRDQAHRSSVRLGLCKRRDPQSGRRVDR